MSSIHTCVSFFRYIQHSYTVPVAAFHFGSFYSSGSLNIINGNFKHLPPNVQSFIRQRMTLVFEIFLNIA